MASYHAPGTCTFYGTANTNQLVMEALGLHLPGASFVPSGTALRRALTEEAGRRIVALASPEAHAPIGRVVDERALVNAIVALLATGGSTNHTMHLVSMAAAAGIQLTWQDFADLSSVVPLLARIYPNGSADINQFQQAGGMASLFAALLQVGLMHEDVLTVAGPGLGALLRGARSCRTGRSSGAPAPAAGDMDPAVLRGAQRPFARDGGIRVLEGSLGRGVIKVSAVPARAPGRARRRPACSTTSSSSSTPSRAASSTGDVVVVVRFQGPRANGMPELHSLTPALGVLQGRGQRVALVTDGRMSGASGKVPAAIHCTPEAADGGPLARLRDGDVIRIDTLAGELRGARRRPRRARARRRCPAAGSRAPAASCSGCSATPSSSADSGATIFDTLDPAQQSAARPSTRSPIHEYAI